MLKSIIGKILGIIGWGLYTEWLITELNSLQDIVECVNRVIYILADCFIRVTALIEYLDFLLATPSWISYYTSVALSMILLHS